MGNREYQRIKIKVESALYFSKDGNDIYEFEGIIMDISEKGIKLSIARNEATTALENVEIGTPFQFSFYDEYSLFGDDVATTITDTATIVRKDITDDEIILGCKFRILSPDMEKYITDIRTSKYYKNLINK